MRRYAATYISNFRFMPGFQFIFRQAGFAKRAHVRHNHAQVSGLNNSMLIVARKGLDV
jgi:hypothetical protein